MTTLAGQGGTARPVGARVAGGRRAEPEHQAEAGHQPEAGHQLQDGHQAGPARPHGTGALARLPLQLYVVTDRAMCAARGVAAMVADAVAGGATAIQVRDPFATDRELYEMVAMLHEQLKGTGVPLIVNNRADVALAAAAEGVHVGQSDLPAPAVRAMAGAGLIVGLSITAIAQLADLESWPAGTVDYLGVGPVFASATKADAAPAMGLAGLAAVVEATPLPCVAIGGITALNVAEVMATGVTGVAVVSAVCASPDPARAAAELRRAIGP